MNTILENEVPKTLAVSLPVTGELMSGIRLIGAGTEAEAWSIESNDLAQLAAEQRTVWARRIDQIKAMRQDFLKPAKDIVAAAEKWFNPPISDLEAGRDILGKKLLTWDQAEKARIDAEKAAIEAENRRIRQEAEAKAAAERAKADEIARELQRKVREAQEAQQRAIAEGNAKAAAKAAQEAARASEQAKAALEDGAAKAAQTELAAAAQVSAAVVPEAVKIAGSSVKDNWQAALAPGFTEDKALLEICKAIAAGRAELLPLVKVDTAARGPLNKLASALKGAMNVPGYVTVNQQTLAGARK